MPLPTNQRTRGLTPRGSPDRPEGPPSFVQPEPDYSGCALLIALAAGLIVMWRTAFFR